MPVDPLKSNALPQMDAGRLGTSQTGRRSDAEHSTPSSADPPAATAGDRVQLSAASRSLVERTGATERVPEGTISGERMRDVRRRLESDYYDRADVRAIVAQRVRVDLGLSTSE